MVHKEGGGPASKCKIEKLAIKYGRIGAIHRHDTPNVPNQAPMRQASKQLLIVCVIPPMYIIIALLPGCQSSILSSNEWHNDMNPAFTSTSMAPNFKIEEITSGTRRTIPIPNENISGCPGSQGANPYNVAQHVNDNGDLENMRCTLGIPTEAMGMESVN